MAHVHLTVEVASSREIGVLPKTYPAVALHSYTAAAAYTQRTHACMVAKVRKCVVAETLISFAYLVLNQLFSM